MGIFNYPIDTEYLIKHKKQIRKKMLNSLDDTYIEKKIAILGGSTTRLVMEMLELFLLNSGIKPLFYESEYNMYYADGYFDNAELELFRPDIVYIHTSNRNIENYPLVSDSRDQVDEKIVTEYNKFVSLWESIHNRYGCIIIQNNFDLPFYRVMGNKDATDYRGRISFINRLNVMFSEYIDSHSNIYIHDILFEQAEHGIREWSNPFYWHMYKYCMCLTAIPYSAFSVSNIIKSIYGKNKKVLNLDCDNTLWGGLVGEDGADNIEIGQETSIGQTYAEFQTYIKNCKDMGILLTINSKNEFENVLSGLGRVDSILKQEDFVSITANWNLVLCQ